MVFCVEFRLNLHLNLFKAGSAAANESVMKCKGRKSKLNGIGPDKDPDNKGPRLTLNYGPKDGTEEGPKMTVEVCHFKARKNQLFLC